MDTSGYSMEALEMLRVARGEAVHLRHEYLGAEHLLLALTGPAPETPQVLGALSLDAAQVRSRIESIVQRGGEQAKAPDELPFTSRTMTALRHAKEFAAARGDTALTPNHIIVGLLREQRNIAAQVLTEAGATEQRAIAALWP